MKNTLISVLVLTALMITANHLCFAQISPAKTPATKQKSLTKPEKIKIQVEKIGIGDKITVIKQNKKKYFGTITNIANDEFQIKDVDTKEILSFRYDELKKVTSGDGEINLITRKRVNPKKGWLYGLAIFGTLLIILGITLNDKDF